MDGICTLANDRVYDQVIALLNSIEAIYGQEMPVCIYPYDDNTAQITAEIARRPQVQIYNNQESIQRWDEFARTIWDIHPTAQQNWLKIGRDKYHRFGTHRRYGAFDGPFERFVYMDADTLLMSPLDAIFNQLNNHDWIVYDFQYTDLTHVYNPDSPKLTEIFSQQRLETEIFCSGLYASKKDIFPQIIRESLLEKLTQGEAEILYPDAPDQTILNYMVMRSGISSYNFANHLSESEKTGCCVTSNHFEAHNNILYDRGNRLTYIHYIGLSSNIFRQICQGENIDFPYRDIFLHYRYLHEPEKRPQFKSKARAYNAPPSFSQRVLKKLGLVS
ncbi:sugar transferase [Nostoc sp. FACHB-152]|uniref:Npun_R2821/Npun_R2822 family protein n=1 Tax=unclassified Nostoc TaxID=2593658 RepID=UPI0016898D58|nr:MULTISPECIES: Npun_R2821/Npun_R2822 family protein [unclassified Nostoc]MBD2449234.1 sugar transferase [Nostoc sp. FACHB-152]MBD2466383.1 sugar transferase [Nostoc sp. FACHB-145]